MSRTACLVGTLDTKGPEFEFLKERIEANNVGTYVINTGILGEPHFEPEVSAEQVAEAGGTSLTALKSEGDRGNSVAAMANGAARIVERLNDDGVIDGIISLGGSAGTTIGTTAMRALPVGVPKLMVSTLASGDTSPYVDTKDITMTYSVVDIAGVNSLSRQILTNAAGAIAGMINAEVPAADDKPLIAATMFGVTTPCVTRLRTRLQNAGFEVVVFHATGSGGRAMEKLIRSGFFAGVADVTTTEWCDEVVGGVLSAGSDRLTAAAESSVPQVVSCGALDMVNFWAVGTVPEHFQARRFHAHNANVTLMRTSPNECARIGKAIAQRLSRARAPVTLVLPLGGVSAIDAPGQPFFAPEANTALFDALRAHAGPNVNLVALDLHINDNAFADALASHLIELL